MANLTADNILHFTGTYGVMYANDLNHQIIIRADRNGTASNYTNYYQYGGTIAADLGHKFWTGGGIASQTLKFQIADDQVKTYVTSQYQDSLGFADKGYISWGGSPARLIMTSCGTVDMALGTDYFIDRFTIKASTGFIGVGTKLPDTRFTVACGDMNIKAISTGNSGKLYFGDEVTTGPGKAIFMETYFMKIQGHRNEGVIIQGVNASGCVREFARFYGDCSSNPNQIHLVPTCGNVGIGTSCPKTYSSLTTSGQIISLSNIGIDASQSYRLNNYYNSGTTSDRTISTGYSAGINLDQASGGLTFALSTGSLAADTLTINVERVRITNSGSVGINTTTPGTYKLNVNGAFYAAGSSCEYKTSICQYNTDSCMFMKLTPVTYQYKDEWCHLGKELKSGTQIGLIAEDVAEVYPELAILKDEDDQKIVRNVDYEKLSIVLLSEVQKLRKELDELKTK
jgi:hypothetical protein